MRRAAGNIEIYREEAVHTVADLGSVNIGSAIDGAGSTGDNDLRGRNRFVGGQQRFGHIFSNRSGYPESVSVTWRGYELDAKAAQIPTDRRKNVSVSFTGVAAAGADLPELERAAEDAAHIRRHWLRMAALGAGVYFEMLPVSYGQLVVRGELKGFGRTLGAEKTFTQVERAAVFPGQGAIGAL